MPNDAPPLGDVTPRANPPLGYLELAWWPEIADGAEGKDMVIALVLGKDGSTTAVLEPKEDALENGHQLVLEGIKVKSTLPAKTKPVDEILLRVHGESEPRPAKVDGLTCDAVFTTPSAVRKFVRLYYETHGMLDDEGWRKLNLAISDANVPAIGHVYPSRSGGVGGDLRFLTTKVDKSTGFVGMEWLTLDQYFAQR